MTQRKSWLNSSTEYVSPEKEGRKVKDEEREEAKIRVGVINIIGGL